MLVARVTFTGSRFLLLSLLFARAYLSHPVCIAGRRRRRKRQLCRKKRKRTNRLLVSHIHYQQQRLPQKKKKTKETFVKHSGEKKKIPICCQLHHFSVVASSLSACCWRENITIIQHVYMPVCHYWLNPYWWLCLQCRLHTFFTGARQKNASRRMNRWRRKNRKKRNRKITKNVYKHMLFSYIKQFFSGNDRCIWQICIINKYRYNKTLEEKKLNDKWLTTFFFFPFLLWQLYCILRCTIKRISGVYS
jgi:hypothetical protein